VFSSSLASRTREPDRQASKPGARLALKEEGG